MEVKNKFEVRLRKLELTNFRAFEKLEVSFDKRLTVFIGINGSGKTTVLDGAASLLQFFIDAIKRQPVSKKKLLDEKDIRNGTKEAVNTITVSLEKKSSSREESEPIELSWYGSLTRGDDSFEQDTITEESAFTDFNTLSQAINRQLKREEPTSIPILVYYHCDYATDAPAPFNDETTKLEAYNAYDDALSVKSFDFRQFFKWYKWREELARASKNGRDRLREVTEQAICSMLSDDQNTFKSLKYRPLPNSLEGELKIDKNGEPISVNQFSSGEKMIFALTADLARRLALANPGIKKPLEGTGIVLIDEIDLHLHPGKQTEILSKLMKTFPGLQFIVTTHSPLILNNMDPNTSTAFVLKGDGTQIEELSHFSGRDIRDLLYSFYGIKARPEAIQRSIDEMFELIESEDPEALKKAKSKLAELKQRLGLDDPAIIDAQNSLEILEEIL